MPTIPYIGGRQKITAGRMNSLWSEFDRRMGLTMDGKSWLLWPTGSIQAGFMAEITGPRFFFTNITTFGRSKDIAGVASPNYDHTVFTTAVAAATEYTVNDHTNKIVFLTGFGGSGTFLDGSLEAHRKVTTDGTPESCWVWEQGAVMPQRRHRYAVAELVFEDATPVTSYTIPNSYDKYQYFRLHNLNPFAITVRFTAFPGFRDFVVTIPAWGCRCCQRRPGGQMEAGFNYFWKFKAGDPRSLTTRPFGAPAPAASMRVNNVWNPGLVFEIIELFSERNDGGQTGMGDANNPVRMIRDPHIVYALPRSLWSGFFGDPANGATLLGDLLHHKGALDYLHTDGGAWTRVDGKFNGYGNLASLTAAGLTVVSSGTGVTIQGTAGSSINDVVARGTNLLFAAAGGEVAAAEISSARAIAHKQPDAFDPSGVLPFGEFYLPTQIASSTATSPGFYSFSIDADGNPVLGGSSTVSFTDDVIQAYFTDETATLKPHSDTVATALAFNTFGLAGWNAFSQENDVVTMPNRRMVLTIFGPMILWDQRYDFVASTSGNLFTLRQLSPGRPFTKLDAGKLVDHRYVAWGGYGFEPFPYRNEISLLFNGSHGGFMNPRRSRAVNGFVGGKHPNYGNPIYGPNGSDFVIVRATRTKSSIRLLYTPGYASPAGGHMPVWSSNDALQEYDDLRDAWSDGDYAGLRLNMLGATPGTNFMPRVKMMRETYNTMASWVNSCVKARPFCWTDFLHYLPATSETVIGAAPEIAEVSDNGNLSGVVPPVGTRGILGTSVRPIEQYVSFESGSALHHLFTTLGVPVKTESDLPANFLSALTAASDQNTLTVNYDLIYDAVTSLGGGNWQIKYHSSVTSVTDDDAGNTYFNKIGGANAGAVFDAAPASWPIVVDDELDVSGYYWVRIADVKAAAEGMGLKFIFEEQSIPLKLTELTVGASFTRLVDTTAYAYFNVSGSPGAPYSTGVQHSTSSSFGPFDVSRMRFVPSTSSPDWKRDIQFSDTVADVVSADVYTVGVPPQGGDGNTEFVIQLDDAPADYLALDYDVQHPSIAYRRAQMYQIYASSGYAIGSKAFRIPVPWWSYASSDFSLQSDDNANARQTLATNAIYPLVVAGSYDGETLVGFASGNNLMGPISGKATEILIYQDTYVGLI